jgi:excisionase family DNA binding protein
MNEDRHQILCVAEVAALLRATPRTVQLWAAAGTLKAFKVGRGWRFRLDDVRGFRGSSTDRSRVNPWRRLRQ